MSILEVPGARLSYETHGSGPVMLLVPGATGSAGSFSMVAEQLAAHYTVVTYDRRGFPGASSMGRRTTRSGSRLTPMTSGVCSSTRATGR